MKQPIYRLIALLTICTLCTHFIFGQKDITLQLLNTPSTLLVGESANFTFLISNTSATDATDISVNFTLSRDFEIQAESIETSNGEFQGGWFLSSLEAGANDTLSFEALSTGYTRFIAEITTDNNLLIGRCFSSDCFPEDNIKCFYTNCTPENDEVLYPAEYAQLEFAVVECFPIGAVGCGAKYNILFKNPSNATSAPVNLFLRAEIGEIEDFYEQSGTTLTVPSIPANDSLSFIADFGACIEDRPFANVNSLQFGLTSSTDLIEIFLRSSTVDVSLLDAFVNTEYCDYENSTDIEVRVESDGIILPDNTATYQVFVTNRGDEIAESVQITYGQSIFDFSGDIISYDATSDYAESSVSQDEESRSRFIDYDEYWTIRNLAVGEIAVLNATATVQEFIGVFSNDIFVNDNSFLEDPNLDNNRVSIEFNRPIFTDLELSVTTDNTNIEQWESGKFTYTLENKSTVDATGVEVRLYYNDDIVPVGGAVVPVSSGNYTTIPDEQFANIGLWKNVVVPAGGSATLEIELFSKVPDLVLCAEVTAADQEDSDSMPSISACTSGEDDEVSFSSRRSACSFFRIYPSLNALSDEVTVEETENGYLIQSEERMNSIDRQGNLRASKPVISEPSPNFSTNITGNEVQFIKTSPEGDTIFNETFTVDYEGADAIVDNSPVFIVSDGLVFGGFIVDFDSDQSFRGFVIKTDLNGQSPQFITVEDIDDTLGFGSVLEDSQGNLYPYWAGAGNFSISRVSADFSSAWATKFASDTPSTDTEDIKLSVDEQKIYVAVTDNLLAEVYAYDTATGEEVAGGFDLTDWIPITGAFQIYRSNGLLPLDNGNLLFSNQFSGDGERFDYSLFSPEGQLIWTQSIEDGDYNLRPVAQTNDSGFLFVNRFDPFSRRDEALQILKTDAQGELSPECNTFEADKLIDLELSISSDNTSIPIFTSATFTLTLLNNGPDDATNVEVQIPIDKDRFVEVGESMPIFSKGNYFQGVWSDIDLAVGESATLEVEIYNKSEILELFAQVTQADQEDADSSPLNATCCTASEDDEAVFVSSNENFRVIGSTTLTTSNSYQLTPAKAKIILYPNPTTSILQVKNIVDEFSYQIHDALGRQLMQGKLNSKQIDVTQLSSGTYFLSILNEDRTIIRFVKQ